MPTTQRRSRERAPISAPRSHRQAWDRSRENLGQILGKSGRHLREVWETWGGNLGQVWTSGTDLGEIFGALTTATASRPRSAHDSNSISPPERSRPQQHLRGLKPPERSRQQQHLRTANTSLARGVALGREHFLDSPRYHLLKDRFRGILRSWRNRQRTTPWGFGNIRERPPAPFGSGEKFGTFPPLPPKPYRLQKLKCDPEKFGTF